VVNDSWDTPDTPRKGATMADIMKRGIVKKREPPVTKWKNTVKRKHKTAGQSATAAAPTAAQKYVRWTDTRRTTPTGMSIIKEEPVDDYGSSAGDDRSDDDGCDNRQC